MNDLFQTSFNLHFTIDNGRRRPSRRDGYAMVLATCFSEDLRKCYVISYSSFASFAICYVLRFPNKEGKSMFIK